MLKVEEIFNERKKYPISDNEDKWLNAIIDTNTTNNDIYLLTFSSIFKVSDGTNTVM